MKDLFTINLDVKPHSSVISLSWAQVCAFYDIISNHNISTFIELGVHEGGMGSLLAGKCFLSLGFNYVGVEVDSNLVKLELKKAEQKLSNFNYKWGNVFERNIIEYVRNEITKSTGRVLLFCDNGNKSMELVTYCDLLRIGDVLVTHDWQTEIFEDDLEVLYNYEELEQGEYLEKFALPAFMRIK